jgi:SAM-dependent methyltransferase
MLDGMVELWNRRPTHFSSALDPVVASIAVSCARLRPGQTLLDPCCGSGTVLFTALGMGAGAVVGLDSSLHMAHMARCNLEAAGYATRGGGALRRWARATAAGDEAGDGEQVCFVGQHDMREGWGAWGLGGLRRVDAVVANLPHGKNLRLPYAGYVTDMLRSLRDCCLSDSPVDASGGVCAQGAGLERDGRGDVPRFVFVGGARLLEEGSGNTLRAALDECGFEGLGTAPALGGALAVVCARLRRP